jgi:hypothetical protein
MVVILIMGILYSILAVWATGRGDPHRVIACRPDRRCIAPLFADAGHEIARNRPFVSRVPAAGGALHLLLGPMRLPWRPPPKIREIFPGTRILLPRIPSIDQIPCLSWVFPLALPEGGDAIPYVPICYLVLRSAPAQSRKGDVHHPQEDRTCSEKKYGPAFWFASQRW